MRNILMLPLLDSVTFISRILNTETEMEMKIQSSASATMDTEPIDLIGYGQWWVTLCVFSIGR